MFLQAEVAQDGRGRGVCVCVCVCVCVGGGSVCTVPKALTHPFHIEGEQLSAPGFWLVPAQHDIRVTQLTHTHVSWG